MAQHPNAALVLEAFRRVANGDVDGMAELWNEKLVYYAFDASGHPAAYESRDEALAIVRAGQQLIADHSYELVDVRAVGAEMVIVQARAHISPSKGDEVIGADYIGVFRVKDGTIVSGCDFIDSATENVLDRAWSVDEGAAGE